MPTYDEAVRLFDERRRAWLAGDLDRYLALWHPDVTFGSPTHTPPLRGREAYAQLVRGSHAAIEPLAFEIAHLAVRGDWVLAEWRIEARHRASGRTLAWDGMSTCAIRDGLIVEWREYWDPGVFR